MTDPDLTPELETADKISEARTLIESLTGYTDGPWLTNWDGDPRFHRVTTAAENLEPRRTYGYGCGNDFICDMNDSEYHQYSDPAEQFANARVIAAAPDLRDTVAALADLAEAQAQEIERLTAERDAAEARGAERMRERAARASVEIGRKLVPIPCPDNLPGCLVLHYRVEEDKVTTAIRALPLIEEGTP